MNRILIFPVAALSSLGLAEGAIAHGVDIAYHSTQAIEITATFDTGSPMAEAQVAVFSPDNPDEPWLMGTTSEAGQFVFTPDLSRPGNWEVQIRQAGHGDVLTIPVSGTGVETAGAGDATAAGDASSGDGYRFTPVQKFLVMGSTIWGFVGTALFFMARKN